MLDTQQKIVLSPYMHLYDMLVPKDNNLRKMHDLVDFSFIHQELAGKYCPNNGRRAESPVRMFKYLLLKVIFDLSDVDVVSHALYDLSFKYFLDLAPEETKLIDPSSLTKFRRQRLKDVQMLELLIGKTVEIAKAQGIRFSGVMIVDSTHTVSCYNMHKPIEILRMRIKNLRHSMRDIDASRLQDMPVEDNPADDLEREIDFCNRLVEYVSKREELTQIPSIAERLNILKESVEDLLAGEELALDKDARIGHKSISHTYNGYKNHIAVDKDSRLITAAVTTTGEVADGPQLQELARQTEAAGIEINGIMGDTAYSGKENLDFCKDKDIPLYSKLHPVISNGMRRDDKGFHMNKDAGMMVCPQGHMAMQKTHRGAYKENDGTFHNESYTFLFDVGKCASCPLREGCYKGGKSKTYTVSIASDQHKSQLSFQKTDEFKSQYRQRYQIEATNADLKNNYGYSKAESFGLQRMQLQSAVAIFAYNMHKIIRKMK